MVGKPSTRLKASAGEFGRRWRQATHKSSPLKNAHWGCCELYAAASNPFSLPLQMLAVYDDNDLII